MLSADEYEQVDGTDFSLYLPKLSGKTVFYAISADKSALLDLSVEDIKTKKFDTISAAKRLNSFRISSGNSALDALFNRNLASQIVNCRLYARTAFYQSGGAIGFRDQLQDCLAMLYINSREVRERILDAAAHQYEDGDVQHWWHAPRFGVRTRISDDLLFLPYVTAAYVKATGDRDILRESVPYLVSASLSKGEKSRFENPEQGVSRPLSEHVERAVEKAYRVGKNGLLLIGGGDWNDALDGVGNENEGESVWLSMFCYKVINDLLEYDMSPDRALYADRAEFLKGAVNAQFKDGRFRRLITKDGEWLGSEESRVIKIDLITQAWAALSGITDGKRADEALTTAKSLIDEDNRLIKLLWPPADDKKYYGYISKYPRGIRENGGQYTHGAVWYIMALFKVGRVNEAYKLLRMINPVEICSNSEGVMRYKGEPYVLSGDVYANPQHEGRAGWSWYTGSAGWYYKCVVEGLYGITMEGGAFKVRTKGLPDGVDKLEIRYRSGNIGFDVTLERGEKGFYVDGVRTENGNAVPMTEGVVRKVSLKL